MISRSPKPIPWALVLFAGWLLCPGPIRAQAPDAFIDNGSVRVGVSRAYGGAITWLSLHDGPNLVNNYDKGRQIQQSYYAGASLRATNQCPAWSPWPWNPIMVGDCSGVASPMLALTHTNTQLYVKSQPMLWDRTNQLSQSHIELWIRFHPTLPRVVVVDNRFTCFRDEGDEWGGPVSLQQEIPAAYFVTSLHTIQSYTGPNPWKNDALSTIPSVFMWTNFVPSEQWAACVDSSGFGVGIFSPESTAMNAGRAGNVTTTNTMHSSTMHIAPLVRKAFDRRSTFEYRCFLAVDSLAEIRRGFQWIHTHPEQVVSSPRQTGKNGDARRTNPEP